MKTDFSVYASLLSATPADAENIAAWLADREAARDAMTMSVDMTVQNAEQLAAESGEYDEEIAVSQIRILSKRYMAEPDVIPYVAVVDKWDDDMWLIVPFSPYKTPATQGEMKTGFDAYGLHVLQAWNGRTVQDQILKKSYLFGTLPEKVREEALSLFRHELGGVPLPENFTAERGSRIVEAADPRREYLDECIERLTPLSEAVLKAAESVTEVKIVGLGTEAKERLWQLNNLDDYAYAAATADVCPNVPLVSSRMAWKGQYKEVSGFTEFVAGDEEFGSMKFYIDDKLDDDLFENGEATVEVYMRETKELVGTGVVTVEDGRQVARIKIGNVENPVSVSDASQIVMVLR